MALANWLNQQQQAAIQYLREENRVLREKLGKKRILISDDQRRRPAMRGKVLGRKLLSAYVGYAGTGSLFNAGDSHSIWQLYLGYNSSSAGTYQLAGISLAYSRGSVGVYNLTGGTLSAGSATVGTQGNGIFNQTGGTNKTRLLTITSRGRYEKSGGSLEVTENLINDGVIDFGGSAASVTIGGGIFNLAHGSFLNTSQLSLTVSNNVALLILPQGFNPAQQAGFTNKAAGTHIAGNTLIIAVAQTITGAGYIDDHIEAAGTLSAASGQFISLGKGFSSACPTSYCAVQHMLISALASAPTSWAFGKNGAPRKAIRRSAASGHLGSAVRLAVRAYPD
ncbi:MAG: hypothetical protein NTU53_08225 [Planctomycetota bacterium]|nr:hypothetical protein [Planctomycetota bacterium]